jgi:hypothetical protein
VHPNFGGMFHARVAMFCPVHHKNGGDSGDIPARRDAGCHGRLARPCRLVDGLTPGIVAGATCGRVRDAISPVAA